MASLLDLTVQGDVATISDESALPQIKLMSPLELYRLWERQNWASHQIDLGADRRDWAALTEFEREQMLYGLSAFFVGEERVTSEFAGLVLAAEDKHEEAFLLTQQVDEARHAQHFNRLYEEVLDFDGEFEDRLAQARVLPQRGLLCSCSTASSSRTTGSCSPIRAASRRRSTSSPRTTW